MIWSVFHIKYRLCDDSYGIILIRESCFVTCFGNCYMKTIESHSAMSDESHAFTYAVQSTNKTVVFGLRNNRTCYIKLLYVPQKWSYSVPFFVGISVLFGDTQCNHGNCNIWRGSVKQLLACWITAVKRSRFWTTFSTGRSYDTISIAVLNRTYPSRAISRNADIAVTFTRFNAIRLLFEGFFEISSVHQ